MRVRTERTGKIFELREPFRSGGEGTIYKVPRYPNLAAKVYHAQKRSSERIAKLQIMVAHPPDNPTEHLNHPSIAWPTDLLRDTATDQVVGFVMPRLEKMLPLSEVYNPRARRRQLPLFNYRYLVRTARNLCAAVQAVHRAGYVIGDLNESNVLVSDQALVTIVDTDSFQVRDPQTGVVHRSLVGKPEYIPPELQGCSFADVDRLPEHDAFALAVLIFRLLMEGFHPFDGKYNGKGESPEISSRIEKGYFPYACRSTPIKPSPLAPPFEMLHPKIRALFLRCFEEGYRDRSIRPRVEDWLSALDEVEALLQQCGQNEQHYYWAHMQSCPWCERKKNKLGGLDPFPSSASVLSVSGHQQPLPSASSPTPTPQPTPAAPTPPTPAPTWLTLTGHTDGVNSVAFSRDGSLLASGSRDGTIRLWRVSDGALMRTLTGHGDWVNSVAFSRDGSLLASGSRDCTVRVRRVSDGALVHTLKGHGSGVLSVAFSPDGAWLASGSRDHTVLVWRVSDGAWRRTLTGHGDWVNSVAFSRDGRLIASGSRDCTVRVRRVSDGAWIRTLKGHADWVLSVAFSPNGSLLASGSRDGTIRLWRVSDGALVRTLTGHTDGVSSVAFSPDGRLIASGSWDGTIRLWRVSDGALVATLTGHTSSVFSVAFSPDGSLIASGSWDATIKLWRVR